MNGSLRPSEHYCAQSVEMVLRDLREPAGRRGFEIVEEYCGGGVNRPKDSRPGLNRLLVEAEAGKFSVSLVWKLDRLGRSLRFSREPNPTFRTKISDEEILP